MDYGYVRVSSKTQNEIRQTEELLQQGKSGNAIFILISSLERILKT